MEAIAKQVFTAELRAEAVKLVIEQGLTQSEVGRRLKKEVVVLREEREILMTPGHVEKATAGWPRAAFFAKESR